MTIPLKIYKSAWTLSGRASSRNYNDLRDDIGSPLSGRSEIEFRNGLRQFSLSPPPSRSPAGLPNLSEYRTRPVPVSEDWFYNDPKYADVSYGNVGQLDHLLLHSVRFRPKSLIKWQIDLRNKRSRSCFSSQFRPKAVDRVTGLASESTRRVSWEKSLRGIGRDNEALVELLGRPSLEHVSDPKLRYLSRRWYLTPLAVQ